MRAVRVLSQCDVVVYWFSGLGIPVVVIFFSSPEGIHGCCWGLDERHHAISLFLDNSSTESDSDLTVVWYGHADFDDYSSSD